jgi:hypothetical protein
MKEKEIHHEGVSWGTSRKARIITATTAIAVTVAVRTRERTTRARTVPVIKAVAMARRISPNHANAVTTNYGGIATSSRSSKCNNSRLASIGSNRSKKGIVQWMSSTL